MYQAADWERLSPEAQQEIMEGALAYHDLKTKRQDYSHWVRIGRALARLQTEAMALVGVNHLQDPKYRRAFRGLLGSEKAGELGEIDSATRTHAVWLANNFEAVEAWLAVQAANKLVKMNHPTTIWRQHPRGRQAEQLAKMSGDQAAPQRQTQREANVELQGKLDEAEAKIRRLERDDDRGPLVTRTDAVEDIARAILEWLPATKRHPVASAMMRSLKSTAPKKHARKHGRGED